MPSGAPAGHTVVWTDRNNEIAADPLTAEQTRLHAISGGVMAASGASGVVSATAWAVRQGLERHRTARWASEREQMNTQKGPKAG
ncbi:hypothetical protein C3492_10105 [Streptomyces sp. Ru62]|uniref:hypothetical protein n=1 Tax=Streptomyces sp. Ru62 TaxID=2080745 RepID=UPI000CDD8493|nr:hypothetical protein [Streptomyces sp. Ru62]POX63510.1 hypothetical protein C3492_10105 [Streptomyces sp. Ru62]